MRMRILAALLFFTRLPLGRIANVPEDNFKHVVPYWALTGWVTAGISILILLAAVYFLPLPIAVLLTIIARLLVTGCLHEDGLADFFDGFGGGRNREQVLTIMKDSHIGSYGVISLIAYFGLYYLLLNSLPVELLVSALLMGDPYSKSVASMIINRLPYARKEEDAKNKTVYTPMDKSEWIIAILGGLLPLLWTPSPLYLWATLFPMLIWIGLTNYIKRRTGGYTGDCCGAVFLLCELSFYIGFVIIHTSLSNT